MYFDQEHGLWLPRNSGSVAALASGQPTGDAAEPEESERLTAVAGSRALAVVICAVLSLAIGLITSDFLPAAGLYAVNLPLSSADGISVSLARIKIFGNGQAKFLLTYTNTGSSAVPIGCKG